MKQSTLLLALGLLTHWQLLHSRARWQPRSLGCRCSYSLWLWQPCALQAWRCCAIFHWMRFNCMLVSCVALQMLLHTSPLASVSAGVPCLCLAACIARMPCCRNNASQARAKQHALSHGHIGAYQFSIRRVLSLSQAFHTMSPHIGSPHIGSTSWGAATEAIGHMGAQELVLDKSSAWTLTPMPAALLLAGRECAAVEFQGECQAAHPRYGTFAPQARGEFEP